MKNHILLGCVILLCLLCGFGNALMVYQNESQLIQASDQIVYGKIVDLKSAWNTQKTHIVTTAQVLVNDTLKNTGTSVISPGSIIPVSVPGGTVGNESEWVEDTPILNKDTEAVFFLKKSNDTYSVVRLYEVINGKIGESSSSTAPNDIAAFKLKINAIEQGIPVQTTTTPKAGMSYAPVVVLVGILFLFWKTGTQ